MRSSLPKPLHRIGGRPMVLHLIETLASLDVDRVVVVVGHAADEVREAIVASVPPDLNLAFVHQAEQRGTGDAVAVGLSGLPETSVDDEDVIVVPGDTPLLRSSTLEHLVGVHRSAGAGATLLTTRLADPAGYGRVLRGRGDEVLGVVEHRDASAEQRSIDEVNTSVYCFRRGPLAPALRRLSPQNAQGEYYLTDVVAVLHDAGFPTRAVEASDPEEVAGVNDRIQLAAAEASLRRRINESWMAAGVTMEDPATTYVGLDVVLAADVELLPGVVLSGRTMVASGARIGPACSLDGCDVGRDAVVERSTARGASIGAGATVGPYAVLMEGDDVPVGGHATASGPMPG